MTATKLICLLLPALAPGDDWRALVEAALDQPTELDISNCPLTEAFDRIVADTGVRVRVSAETLDLLPYGRETRLNARIRNMPLRDGLTQMTGPLGLRFVVADRGIELVPSDPLVRVGRRATWEEIDTLGWLFRQDFPAGEEALDGLMSRLQFPIGEQDAGPTLRSAIQAAGAGRGDEVLTRAAQSLGWTWYPAGKQIAVVRIVDQQLRQIVSLRQTGSELMVVLQALGRQAGVSIVCEPGALEGLPPQTRSNFSLYVENQPLGDALQLVAATTGLGYEVTPEAIVFFEPEPAPRAGGPAGRPSGPYVGKIALPPGPDGTQVELLIQESDLTPDVNELRLKYLERANEAIRETLLRLEQQATPSDRKD